MILHGMLLALLAGLAISAGAWLASKQVCHSFWIKEQIRHGVIAVGGGALISAIAFVLIPDGAKTQPPMSTVLTFCFGGVVFMLLDRGLAKRSGRFSQFMAMMLDFIPEAIVLGAVISENFYQAVFITLVIATQNLPEGYAAFKDLANSQNQKSILRDFLIVGLTGPVYALLGMMVFANHTTLLGMLMTFCSGGILYLVFEDIAPRSKMEKHWLPPMGAVLGFVIGLIGYLYLKT